MLSIRDALGSRWTASWAGWGIVLVPISLVVLLQESSTPFDWWGMAIVSAAAQAVSNIIIALAIAAPFRRARSIIPLGAAAAIWIMVGIARGVIGGLFAETYAHVPGDYTYRVAFWVLTSVIWMPLFVYSMAQLDSRRELLARIATARDHRDAARARDEETATQSRARVASAVQQAIAPVVEEIRASLVSATRLSPTALEQIGGRLSDVVAEAARIIDEPDDDAVSRPEGRAAVLQAADVDQARPWLAPALGGIAVVPLIIPDALRMEGLIGALGDFAALIVGVIVVTFGVAAVTAAGSRLGLRGRVALLTTLTVIGGLLASLTLTSLESPLPAHDVVLAWALPIGFPFSVLVCLLAVGLGSANRVAAATLEHLEDESARLTARSRRRERRVRNQVSSLMHGPVQGRLAACAMALNFHAAGADDAQATAELTERVLSHLDAVSLDLELLSLGGTHVTAR